MQNEIEEKVKKEETKKIKKHKKGLTLVELLAVVVILGLIALVTLSVVSNLILKQKEKNYYSQLNQLILSGENWSIDNQRKFKADNCNDSNRKNYQKVTLSQLQSGGYLSDDFIDTRSNDNSNFSNEDTFLYIYKFGKSYRYCVQSPKCNSPKYKENKDKAANICCEGDEFSQFLESENCSVPDLNNPDPAGNGPSVFIDGTSSTINTLVIEYTLENATEGYAVKYWTDGTDESTAQTANNCKISSCTITNNIQPNTIYNVKVFAYKTGYPDAYDSTKIKTLDETQNQIPPTVTITNTTSTTNTITLSYTITNADDFTVQYWTTNPNAAVTAPKNANCTISYCTLTGLASGTTYNIKVTALNTSNSLSAEDSTNKATTTSSGGGGGNSNTTTYTIICTYSSGISGNSNPWTLTPTISSIGGTWNNSGSKVTQSEAEAACSQGSVTYQYGYQVICGSQSEPNGTVVSTHPAQTITVGVGSTQTVNYSTGPTNYETDTCSQWNHSPSRQPYIKATTSQYATSITK